MNIDIREHIKNNFKGNNETEIKEAIAASLKEQDEITLPGLGVFFELLWANSDDETKNNITNILKNALS